MARARVTSRGRFGGFGREAQVGGFGPDPRLEEQSRAGAQALFHQEQERRQDERQSLELQRFNEREARLQAHEEKMEELHHAEFLRKEAEQSALADRKLSVEKEAAEVLPQMLRMDPTRPEAREFMASMMEKHPNLFISGFAKESITPQIMAFQKEVDAAAKARGIDVSKDAREQADKAALATAVAGGARPIHTQIGKTLVKSPEEIAAEKDVATAKANAPNETTKKQHQIASEKLENAQSNLEDTQAQIKDREKELAERSKSKDGPYDPTTLKAKQAELQALKASEVNWNLEAEKHNAVKTALETIHPQLNPTFKQEVTSTATPPAPADSTPPPAVEATPPEATGEDTVAPLSDAAPVNPNVVTTDSSAGAGAPATAIPPSPVAPATAITPTGGITFKDPDGSVPGGRSVTMQPDELKAHINGLRQVAITSPSEELNARLNAAQAAHNAGVPLPDANRVKLDMPAASHGDANGTVVDATTKKKRKSLDEHLNLVP